MAQRGVEGRIAGIIRWLERFQSSYRSGALESALMDAECARADLEDLRLDLWAKVGSAHAARRFCLGTLCRLSLLVTLLVLATAAPLAKEAPLEANRAEANLAPPPPLRPVHEAVSLAPVATKPAVEGEAGKERRTSPRRSARRASASEQAPERRPVTRERAERADGTGGAKKAARTVPQDKVFSLMQTGARALKGKPSVIEIDHKPRVTEKGEGTL